MFAYGAAITSLGKTPSKSAQRAGEGAPGAAVRAHAALLMPLIVVVVP